VASEIAKALSAQPGVTSADVASEIAKALKAQEPGISSSDVASEIAKALSAQPGVTSSDVASEIAKALKAQPGVTSGDVATEIAKALNAQDAGISSADVASEIASALKAQEPGISTADVSAAIATALAAQQPGISQEDVASAVASAVGLALEMRQASDDAMAQAVSVTAPITAKANATYGGTLNLGEYVFPNLQMDPYELSGTLIKNTETIFGGGLIEYNNEDPDIWAIRGNLADSWIASDDLSKYVFKINKDATWHSGKSVTAEDVVWSLDLMLEDSPAIRPNNHLLKPYLPQGGAKEIGPNTVQFNLDLASAEFLPVLAMSYHYLYEKEWTEAMIAEGKDFNWETQNGFGPFKPGVKKNDISIEVVRNENYWKEGLPYVDRIMMYNLPEGPSMVAAFATGQIHANSFHQITPYSNTDAVQLLKDHGDKLNVEFLAPNGPVGLVLSVHPPFDDVRMRQAYNLVFDRHEFVEVFGAGPGTDAVGGFFGADTFFGFTTAEMLEMPGFRRGPNGEKHPDDIAEAKRLIASWEADHPDGFSYTVDTDTYTYTPGQPHSFTTMTRISSNKVAWAELAMEQLNRFLDFDASVIPIDSASGIDRYNAGTGPGGAGAYFMAGQDQGLMMLPNILTSTVIKLAGPVTGWHTMMPQWFEDAHHSQFVDANPVTRKETLRKMQRYLIEEDPGPLLTLYQQSNSVIWSKTLKNFTMPPNHYASLVWEHVWIEE